MSRFGNRTHTNLYVSTWISSSPTSDLYQSGTKDPIFYGETGDRAVNAVPQYEDSRYRWIMFRGGTYAVNVFNGAVFFNGIGLHRGGAYVWGNNSYGALGLNVASNTRTSTPTRHGIDGTCTAVAAASGSQGGIFGGKLYTWGINGYGVTGLGTTTGNTLVPTQVGTSTTWTALDMSGDAALGIDNGKLYAWGTNFNGQTGLNTTIGTTTTPTQVGVLTGWTHVMTQNYCSLGINGGKLYAWGDNSNGQTGLGLTTGNTLVPTQVGVLTTWTHISGSISNQSFGIAGGKLYSFGINSFGATGLNTTTGNTTAPTQVGTLTNWTAVQGAYRHARGIESGKLYTWGSNGDGGTGLGTTSGNNLVPVQVGTITNWKYLHKHASFGYANGYGIYSTEVVRR